MKKLPQGLLIVVGLMLIGLTILRISQSWPNDSHLDHVSGAWIALATDLRISRIFGGTSEIMKEIISRTL